jgi:hypothetical protein
MQHRVTLTTILIIFTNNLIITPEINLLAGGGAETGNRTQVSKAG